MAALPLNLKRGYILLGIEDDGRITGMSRDRKTVEEWIMNVVRQNIMPAVVPMFNCIKTEDDKSIEIIEMPLDSFRKPYKARKENSGSHIHILRVESTSREVWSQRKND